MKKIIISFSTLFVAGMAHAQTTAENYIQTRTYLEEVTASSLSAKQLRSVQYFDGLGRPKQLVNVKASPSGKDVVTPIEYDGFGRQVKNYLPIPQTSTFNGEIVSNPLGNVPSVYGPEKIYSEKKLESSSLDRPLQQIQVGNEWAAKPVQLSYETNAVGEVNKYTTNTSTVNNATNSSISLSGSHGAAQLYKNTVTDEDGNKIIEFKNEKGQTLLSREINGIQNADTYYIYNEYDQLAFVIPPLASAITTGPDQTALDNLCYQYRYDGKNRLVEKKTPGKGWEYMVYDKSNRLVLSQDANLRGQNKWLIYKYDRFGRVVYMGFLTGGDRSARQNEIANLFIIENRDSSGFTRNGITVYYTDNNFIGEIPTILSINYYDTYPSYAFNPPFPTTLIGGGVPLQDVSTSDERSTKGLPVMSLIKNIEDDNWTKNYNYYDKKGRVIGTYSVNHLGGYTKTETELDFSGVPLQTKTYHKRLDTDTEKVITQSFTYDHQNRLLEHKHKVDNNAEEILAQNKYNEISQLESKKVGGINPFSPLQTLDYSYNIRGWLTQVNEPRDMGNDLFGYKINYNRVDGLENPNTDYMDLKVKPKYNGNIAEVYWKTNTVSGDNFRRYGYVYDGMNRLLAGFYQKDVNESAKEYFEIAEYDLNGNITNLKRSEGLMGGSTAMIIDNLNYAYTGNRLDSVTDLSGQYNGYPDTSGNIINYDPNGNMKNHTDKGILQIDYNYLNLPSYLLYNKGVITRTGIKRENTNYLYRADGVKLRKIYYYNSGLGTTLTKRTTDYLDGFQYEGNKTDVLALKFVPTSEGYYNFENNKYIYNYTDHLGNVRLSYADNGSGPEVIEENNYYPFGMKHEGYNALNGNPSYNYKYNGKELQESTMYDYGARQYMPDLGRWGVIDEKTEKYRSWSPYNYAIDNPIKYVDPDGKDIINVAGGVRFTGEDAKILFSFFQNASASGGLNIKAFHFVPESVTPNIYRHTLNAFRNGKQELLHYDADLKRRAERRKEAIGKYPTRTGMQRDEYPFASTFEGGKNAMMAYVPSRENSIQGGTLSALYKAAKLQTGDAFLVIPVPKDREPEDVKQEALDRLAKPVPTAVKVGTAVGAGIIVWEVIKWTAAVLLAPETMGASIPAAAAIP